jgi:receptor-type tyrosine-protein phosphatase Q
MRGFVRALFREFPFGPDANDTRVAIVSYSSAATTNAFFSPQGTSTDSMRDIIAAIPGTGGSTDTAEALALLRTDVFTVANGMRPASDGVPKLAVLMSDGVSNSATAAVAEAELLRNAGVTILALQVGSSSASLRAELIDITNNVSLVFTVADFDDLAAEVSEITTALCNVDTAAPTTVSPTTATISPSAPPPSPPPSP